MADSDLIGAYVTPDIYLVRPDADRLDTGYLAAFLNRACTTAKLRASKKGAKLPRMPKESLSELVVPLPSMERQRLIGGLATAISRHSDFSIRRVEIEARLFERLLDRAFMAPAKG